MDKMKRSLILSCMLLVGFATVASALTDEEKLGKLLYFDKYLSLNHNQSCASCHLPATGFVDPLNVADPYNNVVSIGSDPTLNGGRNAPTSGYAAFIPIFTDSPAYAGGQFWDGRANTLKDQAKGPFLNPVEMGLDSEADLAAAIADPKNKKYKAYKKLFASAYQIDLTDYVVADVFNMTAQAIAVFEQTNRFRKFSSKYDYYLAGQTALTFEEESGRQLFLDNCNACHPMNATVNPNGNLVPPLFSDYSYDNLGIPKSENFLIADNPIDYGLGGRLNIDTENGKFRVPSLRNIELTPPYGHNGYFATLEDIVNFYNTAGDDTWPSPEVDQNVNRTELGNLALTPQQEADLVAFLKTLTDGDTCAMPAGFVLPDMTPLD